MINNGNWTEWSAIWAEIIHVIWKSNGHTVRVQFEITSMISDQNCTKQGSITTLLHPFWNHPNRGLGQFKCFIRCSIELVWNLIHHFWRGKSKSFGNKSCKMILFVFHFLAMWLVTLNKPWNLIACFLLSWTSSLAGKKAWFKAKNGAIRE